VRVEIMGSPRCRNVGESRSVLMVIHPMISPRTPVRLTVVGCGWRRRCACVGACVQWASLSPQVRCARGHDSPPTEITLHFHSTDISTDNCHLNCHLN
jgi:hypothetical protein